MIRYSKITFFIVVLLTGLSSCNKWLELKPQDGIIKEEFWKTKEQVQSAVTGIYASLLGGNYAFTGGIRSEYYLAETLWLWGEARADMVSPAPAATNFELDIVNANILPTNPITNWRTLYRTINYCNTVIQLAPAVLANDPTFTQAQLDNALSEAYAIRALMYFYLVRTFRDVPLKLTATISDQDLVNIPKTSADSVLNQIVADLKKAETGAVASYGNAAMNKGRVTKYTVNAILADVYLWMDKYTECVAECDKIINSNQFGLLPGNASWFNDLYVNGNSTESIFEFQFDAQRLNPFNRMFVTARTWIASYLVMDRFYTIDLVNDQNKDIRAEGAAVRSSDATIWKLVGADNNNALRSVDQSFTHWFVYRYADILLMKAEALNQAGNGAGALQLLYRVRQRANALANTDLAPDPSNKQLIADFILAERGREFAFEGKRWYDLLRNAKRQYTTQPDFLARSILESIPPERQQSVIAKYRDVNSHYFPIYFYELQTNKLLIQNPFYK